MAEMSRLDRYKFRRALEEIDRAVGRGTELVSLSIPPGRPIFDVTNYLRAESSQSSNIKSASTRKHVMQAIESAMQRLKSYKMPPTNGLVVFTGHKQVGADQTQMVAVVLQPPAPRAFFPLPLRLEVLHGAAPRDARGEGPLWSRGDRPIRGDPRPPAREADRGDQEPAEPGAVEAPDGRPERTALRATHRNSRPR